MKVSEVAVGEGVADKIDGTRVAIYNTGDELVVLKNVCTHMGCETGWNSADKTWDCPCHGSRYYSDGSVLEGPAPKPLERLSYQLEGDAIIIG